ncbi:MAG: transglutaminase domain-containing protein [Firmicutes bacterium]|nr:transglutaminase domain-containing protein [Bacillota bacterium]
MPRSRLRPLLTAGLDALSTIALLEPVVQWKRLPHAAWIGLWPGLWILGDQLTAGWRRVLRALLVAAGVILASPQLPLAVRESLIPAGRSAAETLLATVQAAARSVELGVMLAILAVALGQTFSRPHTRMHLTLRLALGVAVLAVLRTFLAVPVTAWLAVYLAAGLLLLLLLQGMALQVEPSQGAPRRVGYWLPFLMAPFVAADLMPAQGSHWPVQGWVWPSLLAPRTGLGIGVPNINHPVTLTDNPVMAISGAPRPMLWETETYTDFDGVSWSNPSEPSFDFASGQPVGFGQRFYGVEPTLTVVVSLKAPTPDIPYHGRLILVQGSSPTQHGTYWPRKGLFQWAAPQPTQYRVTMVPSPGFFPFRRFPTTLDAYLQLPPSLSPQVVALARQITQGTTSPMEAVDALVRYLDTHERYTLNFSPAANQNAVNRFLLVTHAGYCDQFSSSLVMMARAVGIPARWVVGYAPGGWDPTTHTTIISSADAHSWAQVWVPGSGWVDVDPTPAADLPGAASGAAPGASVASPAPPSPSASPSPAPAPANGGGAGGLRLDLGMGGSGPLVPWTLAAAGAAALLGSGWGFWYRRRPRSRTRRFLRRARRLLRVSPRGPYPTWREGMRHCPVADLPEARTVLNFLEHLAYAEEPPSLEGLLQAERALTQLSRQLQKARRQTWRRATFRLKASR